MTNYVATQFKLGKAGTRYNSNSQMWHPRIGGAVKFGVAFKELEEALSQAEVDLKDNNRQGYE